MSHQNDYSVLRSELLNLSIWCTCLAVIHLTFGHKPYLFNDPSEDIWFIITSQWPYDIRYLYVLLNFMFSAAPFLLVCAYYDMLYKYKVFSSYRISPSYASYPAKSLVSKSVSDDFKFQLICLPLLNFLGFNIDGNFDPIPNVFMICIKFLGAIYLFDILFHLSHAALHHPFLYKYHKLHHEYKETVSWAGTWTSWFEFFFCTFPSTILPIGLLSLHPFTALLYTMYRNVETAVTHSGYDLPLYLSPLFVMKHLPGHYEQERLHAFHHSHNDGCFGFYFTDSIWGSNEKFRKYYFKQKLTKRL
eukprot:149133_1